MNWRILNEPQRLQQRIYRLIDGLCEPHRQLDALYPSLEAAIEDAIGWLQQSSINPLEHPVGVEVATGTGIGARCAPQNPCCAVRLCLSRGSLKAADEQRSLQRTR